MTIGFSYHKSGKVKICFILEHFFPHIGGGETLFWELAKRLSRLDCKVKVLTSDSGGTKGSHVTAGLEVHYFPWRSLFGHPIPKKKDLVDGVKWCDIVHTATYTAGPKALAIAKKFDKPCLISVHEVLRERWHSIERPGIAWMLKKFEMYSVKKDYSFFHATSQATQGDLLAMGIPTDKIFLLYPGIRETFERARVADLVPDSTSKIFLYFGRAGKTKGVEILLKAIAEVDDQLPEDFRFVLVLSEDPKKEREKIVRSIRQMRGSRRVEVKNSLSDDELAQMVAKAYCVIIPSLTEGFGFTAAEASHAGRPLIVSDAGSLPEVASGKVLFFKNRDSRDLADKIILASQNRFQWIPPKTFDFDASAQTLFQVYRKLLTPRPLLRQS